MSSDRATEERWMARCLELAKKGAGVVSPNPLVGAVIVADDGQVLGEGWHGFYGGAHAEIWAIRDVLRRHDERALRRAVLYVNLEPCSHHGKTPPCADTILRYGIPRVVVGMVDPNPEVAGGGIARLRAADIEVETGVLGAASFRLNEAFVHHIQTGRPLVTAKVAETLDGQIATSTGDSRWISGEVSRRLVHRWRAELDAVMVGSGTAMADNPALTVRHVGGRQPLRIVLDAKGILPPDLRLLSDEHVPRTIVAVRRGEWPRYGDAFVAAGGRVLEVAPEASGGFDLADLLHQLGQRQGDGAAPVQSVLVEPGPGLATALFARDLIDRYYLFIAPKLIGTGTPSLGPLRIEKMVNAIGFVDADWERVGEDFLFRGYRRRVQLA